METEVPTTSHTLICGSDDAKLSIIMFHGYTASPDEFRPLAEHLSRTFNAKVIAPLLPGHGTKEEDLLSVTFEQLVDFAKKTVARETANGKPFILLGHSMGGYLALLASEGKRPGAIIITTTPFVLTTYYRRFWVPYIARTRAFWSKKVGADELEARKHLFFYPRMPGVALWYVKKGIRLVKKVLPQITCPILTIHNAGDPISLPESGERMLALSGRNPKNRAIVLEHDSHGLYYGPHQERLKKDIVVFIETLDVH